MDKMNYLKNFVKKTNYIFLFKILFIALSFFYIIPFTNHVVVSVYKILIPVGVVIVFMIFRHGNLIVRNKSKILIIIFLILSGISVIVNYRYNIERNLIIYIYLIIMTIIPLSSKTKEKESILKELIILCRLIIYSTFVIGIFSLLIYLFYNNLEVRIDKITYFLGTYEGRLFGLYGNPNTSALIAYISIILSAMLFVIYKLKHVPLAKIEKVLIVINGINQVILLFLANSRSVLVTLIATIFFIVVFLLAKIYRRNSNKFKYVAIISVAILLSASVIPISNVTNKVLSNLKHSVIKFSSHDLGSGSDDINLSERNYYSDDITNGRFLIWKAAFNVSSDNLIFGVSNEGVNSNLNQWLPDDMVKKTKYLSANTHNIYLQVLVSSGMPSMIFFILFLMFVCYDTVYYLIKEKIDIFQFSFVALLFLLFLGLCIDNLFDSNIMNFMSVFTTSVFWVFLGNLLLYIKNEKEDIY